MFSVYHRKYTILTQVFPMFHLIYGTMFTVLGIYGTNNILDIFAGLMLVSAAIVTWNAELVTWKKIPVLSITSMWIIQISLYITIGVKIKVNWDHSLISDDMVFAYLLFAYTFVLQKFITDAGEVFQQYHKLLPQEP